jgi:sorting nexin-1/2
MDEEADFANILSQSTISKPTWTTTTTSDPSSDPWANPFSSPTSSPNNPFASSTSAFGSTSAYVPALPQLDTDEVSPYVSKLEEDDRFGIGNLPDPPSVIAAREQEASEAEEGFGSYDHAQAQAQTQAEDPFTVPYSPPKSVEPTVPTGSPTPPSRKLPSDLIDEDLLAASDPSVSLKKAFVKSSPAPRAETKVDGQGKKAYVFTPSKPAAEKRVEEKEKGKKQESQSAEKKSSREKESVKDSKPAEKAEPEPVVDVEGKSEAAEQAGKKEDDAPAAPETVKPSEEPSQEVVQADNESKEPAAEEITKPTTAVDAEPAQPQIAEPVQPESIPLPASGQATPSISRIASPVSANGSATNKTFLSANDLFSPNSTPKHDRVAVSPLDPPPPAEKDYGFHHLSIGGSSSSQGQSVPPPPPKSGTSWTQPSAPSTGTGSGSRFAGKGWAAVDETDDLFGAGGPSARSDPWGGDGDGEGWAGDNVPIMSGPSQVSSLFYGRDVYSHPVKQQHVQLAGRV